jgi:ElaB/YqjD/DUF883 family membrane-anchored ribosome-binding protein
MYQEDLPRLLDRLREELGASGTLSHESRNALRSLADEIDHTLQAAGEQRGIQHTEHRHRLEELVTHFEADHPGIAATMREVMHSLGKIGI